MGFITYPEISNRGTLHQGLLCARVVQMVRHSPELVMCPYECSCDISHKEMHHPDYSQPYLVVKLCRSCHAAEHRRLRQLAKS